MDNAQRFKRPRSDGALAQRDSLADGGMPMLCFMHPFVGGEGKLVVEYRCVLPFAYDVFMDSTSPP